MKKAAREYTADDIVQMLHQRFAGKEHIVLHEVADSTGAYQHRWVDVAVFGLWPSKGLDRAAFEVKVSRGDLLRELQNPQKYQWARDCFHEFWYVGPKEIFQDGELPLGAGLMCPRGDKLSIKTHCQRNDNPMMDDSLLASFMRSAVKGIDLAKKAVEKDILESSPAHQNALGFKEAVRLFLESRGVTHYDNSAVPDIVEELERANSDAHIQESRKQLLRVAGRFQKDIASLVTLMATIASRGVLARNEVGKFAVGAWGMDDHDSVAELKKIKQGIHYSDYEKRYAQLIELLLNWESL